MNLGQENEKQEFKLGLAQLDKGLKSLSAMLNRGMEGTVYFGVDDDGTVKGLEIGKRTLLDIRSRAAELIEPHVILDIHDCRDEEGHSYISVHATGSDIPYSCDGRYYLRTVSADEKIGSDLLRKMLVSGSSDLISQITAETQLLTFHGMVNALKEKNIHAADSEGFLRSFGMFNNDGKYNFLSFLLSDQNNIDLKIMRFAGTDKSTVEERISFSGQCLLISVQKVLDYFQLINLPKKVDLSSGIRKETPLFDYQSFREAWINACVHNTWTEKIPPAIYLYDDRIEIVSYGGLPYGLSQEGFFAGISKPVNHRLFQIFITCLFSEQSGHGIPLIVKTYGKESFSFRDGLMVVTLPFGYVPDYVKARQMKETARNLLTLHQQKLLTFFSDHPTASLQEAAEVCSLSLGGVKKITGKLQELGLLERKGAKNRSTWIVH